MPSQAPATTKQNQAPQTLDDIMLAMDIVDTLRHRALIVEKELGTDAREEDMLRRLREIYAGQGIEVPDHILRDGVKALEENRFVYTPPKDSFSIKIAKAYVNRDRWLKPVLIVLGLAVLLTGIYQFGFAAPQNNAFVKNTQELEQVYEYALSLAKTDFARETVRSLHNQGITASQNRDRKQLGTALSLLQQAQTTLEQTLTVRIISRPGELSGVFRIPDDAPDTRNYYLIVEAVDINGTALPITITSEEDQKTARTSKWGVRVSEAVFDGVKADKSDDQIIQQAVIGEKPRGTLRPQYTIQTNNGGEILDW